MNASRGLIVFFGMASVGLAGLVAVELQPPAQPTRALQGDAAAPADRRAAKAEPPPRTDSVRSYDVISDRPLFSESRRPAEPLPEEEADPTSENLRHMSLTGVIITPARKTALIYSQNNPDIVNLQEGQSIEGWRLDKVMHDRIVLSHGEATTEIDIWDLTRPRPPRRQPAAPNRPARNDAAKGGPKKAAAAKKPRPEGAPPAGKAQPGKAQAGKAPAFRPAEAEPGDGKASEERVVRKASDPDR
jgi:hypothetical protein